MRQIDVCLSPELLHLYSIEEKIVVAVDVLRATSCIVTAMQHGAERIAPMADRESCIAMKAQGYIIAGEHNGERIYGFDRGNSPFEYMGETVQDKRLAILTTNGTGAIQRAKAAHRLLIGSFLNLNAIVEVIGASDRDALILCAGWKGRVNMEDSLFAGAVFDALTDQMAPACDAVLIARHLYRTARGKIVEFLSTSSHTQRLKRLGLERDIEFCLTPNQYHIAPILRENHIVV